MIYFRILALTLLAVLGSSHAIATSTPDEKEVTLSGTLEWQMQNERGQPYHIMISKPEGDLPWTGGYPVIYVLDANAYFASLHEAKRSQEKYRHAIIVGIGYPGDKPLNFLRRAWDFSPDVPEARNDPPQGGDDELLDFLQHKLMPAVAKRFKIDPHQQTLYGHSFGGMFAIYALFERPGLFNHIVSASPSLWWNNRYLLPHEKQFSQQVRQGEINVTHTSLALIMGEYDSLQEIQDATDLQQRLQPLSAFGLRTSFRVEDGEDHMSVPFRIESHILRQVLEARRI